MRIRALAAMAAVGLVVNTLTIPAAQATTNTVMLRSGSLFGPWQTGVASYAKGPGSPPAGVGSLHLGAHSAVLQMTSLPGADLTALSAYVWQPATNSPGITWVLSIDSTGGSSPDMAVRSATTTSGWQFTDLLTEPLTVTESGNETPTPTTWSDLLAAHPDMVVFGIGLANEIAAPSEGNWALDLLSFGTAGSGTTTYDFEPLRSTVKFPTPRTPIANGDSVTLRATVSSAGQPLANVPAQLWVKAAGASAFTRKLTTTTSSIGKAATTLHPRRTAVYQWRYSGDATHIGSSSTTHKIVVTV